MHLTKELFNWPTNLQEELRKCEKTHSNSRAKLEEELKDSK